LFLRPERNVLEAATLGATSTIKLVSYVVVNLISFQAAVKMFNWLVNYLGGLLGIDGLSFEVRTELTFQSINQSTEDQSVKPLINQSINRLINGNVGVKVIKFELSTKTEFRSVSFDALNFNCFQLIAGYVFTPLAWAMGADWQDCGKVGQLVGTKTILSEFIAYVQLADMIKNGTISVSLLLFNKDPDLSL
jgi:nucleoside permease NupC